MSKIWVIVGCQKYCYSGYIGIDNCNICGCSGSQFIHISSKNRYPNTREGWIQMRDEYSDVESDEKDLENLRRRSRKRI